MQSATVATTVQPAKARSRCTSATQELADQKRCEDNIVTTDFQRSHCMKIIPESKPIANKEVQRQEEHVATNVFKTESLRGGTAEREEVADEEAEATASAKQTFQVVVVTVIVITVGSRLQPQKACAERVRKAPHHT